MPKISVLINNYNYGKYVGEAITSVLSQNYPDFELIVVDDGSTDNSREVTRSFHDGRIKIVEKPNGGQLSAFNAGISASKGEIVCFLDADDMYPEGHLRAIDRFFSETPDCDFLFMPLRRFGNDETNAEFYGKTVRFGSHPFSAALIHLWIGNSTSACAVRRRCAERIFPLAGFEADWKTRADDVLIWGADIVGAVKYYSPCSFARYRVHGENRFFGSAAETEEALQLRQKHAEQVCAEIMRRNALSPSELLKTEAVRGTYPGCFTLRAFARFLKLNRRNPGVVSEVVRCLPSLFRLPFKRGSLPPKAREKLRLR